MRFVYTIVENGEAYPNAFTSYNDALDEVKKTHADWHDNEEDEVDVEEGNKIGKKRSGDPNITELYIEKEIYIFIYKLTLASKPTSSSKSASSFKPTSSSKPLRRHSIGGKKNKKNVSTRKRHK